MTVLKCPRVVSKIPSFRDYYVAAIHIDCYTYNHVYIFRY